MKYQTKKIHKQDAKRDDPLILIWFDLIWLKRIVELSNHERMAQIPNEQRKKLQSHKFFISSLKAKSFYVLFFNSKRTISLFSFAYGDEDVYVGSLRIIIIELFGFSA